MSGMNGERAPIVIPDMPKGNDVSHQSRHKFQQPDPKAKPKDKGCGCGGGPVKVSKSK